MQNRKNYPIAFLLLFPFLFFISCARTTAPRGWLSSSSQMQSQSFGGWIQVDYKPRTGSNIFVDGELLAISSDTLYILTEDVRTSKKLHSVAILDVTKARLVSYDSQARSMGGLVALGTLSTLSHGFYLILTAPILWSLAGGATASSQSRKPIIDYPKRPLKDFQPYARFPQRLPLGLRRAALRPKPISTYSQ